LQPQYIQVALVNDLGWHLRINWKNKSYFLNAPISDKHWVAFLQKMSIVEISSSYMGHVPPETNLCPPSTKYQIRNGPKISLCRQWDYSMHQSRERGHIQIRHCVPPPPAKQKQKTFFSLEVNGDHEADQQYPHLYPWIMTGLTSFLKSRTCC